MFILDQLGPVIGPKIAPRVEEPTHVHDNDEHESPTSSGSDSFTVLENPGSPYPQIVSAPKPQPRVAPPAQNGNLETPREQVSRRLTGCDGLPCELRDSVTEHLSQNPSVTASNGNIRLVSSSELFGRPSSNTAQDILDYGVQNGLINQEQADELLAEFAKFKEQYRAQSQELELVLAICAASGFPEVALGTLKGLVGYFHTEVGISAANGAISQFAGWAMDEARNIARTKGDPSAAKNLISILEGYSHAPHSSGGDHQGLAAVGAEGAPGGEQVDTHVQPRVEEVYAVDDNNNILGVAYYQYTYEEVPELHAQAHVDTTNTISSLQIAAGSNAAEAEQLAGARRSELQEGYSARERVFSLHYSLSDDDPTKDRQIAENEQLVRRHLGTA